MKELLGTMYFTPQVDTETGKLSSHYEGKVVAFVVRRDDGSEYEVRKERSARPGEGKPLSHADMQNLKEGQPIAFLGETVAQLEVVKVFPLYGDVWVRNTSTKKQTVVKYHELKRVA